jgi:acyl-coenzyme A synthetase/AMP-(fatty) acid ligase
MPKISGIGFSPFGVESALSPRAEVRKSPELAAAPQGHVNLQLAPCKYPRWIELVEELPKTASGKISASSCASKLPKTSSERVPE